MGLYLDKIPSIALKTRYRGNAPPKTDIFALMIFFWKAFHYMDPQKRYNRFLEARKHFLINRGLTYISHNLKDTS